MFAMLMGLKSISPKDLHERMRKGPLTIVDVNNTQSWERARVPGAINLGVDFDAAALPQDFDAGLVFYCSNPLCRKAPNAAKRAKSLGYSDVRVMSAGITGWTDAHLPVDSGA
ncbi:rhodanese-like domain-containing protein [Massilia glaciei]|uniref:Rhodanese-like domain-containing protein n=1 Tax=Massilia glaciei TaxID=1524097 RepID=A0A2U2HNL7_9BURK|nr:rhodanese-like domain-containing protein [Massilia glaciei]PWF49101.1 rhodanese-like domain-containing protein [Massilia glaciei]